ncbi:MAG: HD domain-containing protein [Weeksellaceae bacterium]
MQNKSNKLKIFNDPLYGFISIPDPVLFDLIEEKSFQRLRRITQTGLTHYVYPGANHTRFLHALGCLHLMQKAVETLRQKNVKISEEEERAVYIAILLHDVGHGPYSHALESTIVEGIHHEDLSLMIMQALNEKHHGALDLAIEIFQKKYHRKFLSQLIASQLDIDRLDYLKRDSFFTGVTEGNIGSDRIISMMNVSNDELVIDVKGIYSVEKYLIARMFMYWQVYLHKTSVAAEIYLIQSLRRAKELAQAGQQVSATPALQYFLERNAKDNFTPEDLEIFLVMDDSDIMHSLKQWQNHPDYILRNLASAVVQRNLGKAEIRNNEIPAVELKEKQQFVASRMGEDAVDYFVHVSKMQITPYNQNEYPILLLNKEGSCVNIAESDKQILTRPLFNPTQKYHFCYLDETKLNRIL